MKTKLAEEMFNLSKQKTNPSFKRYLSKVKKQIRDRASNGQTSVVLPITSLKNRKKEFIMNQPSLVSSVSSFLKKEGFSISKENRWVTTNTYYLKISW